VEDREQQALLRRFGDHEPRLVSGGSVANSVIACSQLGGRCGFIGCVGDDRYGLHYVEEFGELEIDFINPPLVGAATGTCVSIITPDAERTMRTCLAVSSHLAARHVDAARIATAAWLFVEGYLFANPHTGQHAVREAVRAAKAGGTKIALTCSDAFIPHVFGEPFREALAQSDLLFCNATEAMAVAGGATAAEAFGRLRDLVPDCVVTDGPNGAYVRWGQAEHHVPAFPCRPVDLTGAGDMFAGAYLYGLTRGVPADTTARAANHLAMKVITQIGARLHHGTKLYWEEMVG
jgi:sugar/nucleoside kinase (ribokinase family)